MQNELSYLLITTARNEAVTLPKLIQQVVNQKHKPHLWLICDDRSTDETKMIILESKEKYKFIRYYSLSNFDYKYPWRYHAIINLAIKLSSEIATKENVSWNYIGILDADIDLVQESYFEEIISYMHSDSKIGIACGRVDDRVGDKIIIKKRPANRPAGAARVLSKHCILNIGEYPVGPSGDSITTDLANKFGYKTIRLSNLYVIQERRTNRKSGKYLGIGKHYVGTHPLFTLVITIKLLLRGQFRDVINFNKIYFYYWFNRMPQIENSVIKKLYRYKV